jgi:hypothetical protein
MWTPFAVQADYLRLMLGRHSTRTSRQMFQFWRVASLTDRMAHQAGQTVPDHSLVREPSYLGLNSNHATGWPNMGAHQA